MIESQLATPPIAEIVRTIADALRPRRIVLFGSRARGDAREDSDVDLMIELETELPRGERDAVVRALFSDRRWPMDLLVYTPEEIDRWCDDVGHLLYDVKREGKVLYAAPGLDAEPRRVRERPEPRVPESLAFWIRRAESDLRMMELALRDQIWDGACFHAHQGIEKLLKACMVACRTKPPRTHDLRELLAACGLTTSIEAELRPDAALLQALWPKSRYPEDPEPTAEEGSAAVAAARRLAAAIRPRLDQRSFPME